MDMRREIFSAGVFSGKVASDRPGLANQARSRNVSGTGKRACHAVS